MNCVRRGKPIDDGSLFITDIGGNSHSRCYYLMHPFKPAATIRDVLNNGDDQVIVRQLIEANCDTHTQQKIIAEFNEIMRNRWENRVFRG